MVRPFVNPTLSNDIVEFFQYRLLYSSVESGNVGIVGDWVLRGGDINEPIKFGPSEGATLLFTASAKGQLPMVQYLISQGAVQNQISIGKFAGSTAVFIACQEGKLDVVEYLIQHGSQPDFECLDVAIAQNHLPIVKHLVEGGYVSADMPCASGKNVGARPIDIAVTHGRIDHVRHLIAEKDVCPKSASVSGRLEGDKATSFL
jgi:ankyrin repeat protein